MNRMAQTIIGVLYSLVGIAITGVACWIMVLAKSPTMWGVILAVIGLAMLWWGGVMVPNSGVEDGAHRLTIFVTPWIDWLPSGRRRTDPQIPPAHGDPNAPPPPPPATGEGAS